MRTCWKSSAMLLLLAGFASGCAIHHSRPNQGECVSLPRQLDCRPTSRRTLVPDVSLVPEIANRNLPDPQRQYCLLTEPDAIFLAATHSPIARLLSDEVEAIQAQVDGRIARRQLSGCVYDVIRLQASHERNRSASLAVQTLFRLAEAEAGSSNLRERLDVLAEMSTDIEHLQRAGIASPFTFADIELQMLELQHKQLEVDDNIEQLNRQLTSQLGVELPIAKRIWPDVDLKISHQPQPEDEAIALAMMKRCDLQALRCALSVDAVNDLPALRTIVGAAHPGAGMALETSWRQLRICEFDTGELSVRRDQIASLLSEQEQAVERDIVAAIAEVENRVEQVAISRQKLRVQQTRIERQRQAVTASNGTIFEGRKLRLEQLGYEQDLLHDVIEWKLAVIRLLELEAELLPADGSF